MRFGDGAAAPDALLRLHERHPERYPVLLESVGGDTELGRYDLLLALPGAMLLQHADGRLDGPAPAAGQQRFLAALDACWRAERVAPHEVAPAPFVGGWFLYLGYELAGEIEPTLRLPRAGLPRALAWRMHGAVVRDRQTGALRLHAEAGFEARLGTQFAADLAGLGEAAGPVAANGVIAGAMHEEPAERFLKGVRAVLDAIGRGDVYQANLSRAWQARLAPGVRPSELYRRLRAANPAPFAGSAVLPGFDLLSSSPERLLRIRGNVASTRPIAGTRPRGITAAHDEALRVELRLNEKEQAEHVMLVDL
ncbi:MAG: chorismate-binding protein, partial [Steroidobacteraceae bacterium]|nr:chorismate-binding protein [Steroidobacteraceae bacterium]